MGDKAASSLTNPRHVIAFGVCGLLATATDILIYEFIHQVMQQIPVVARLLSVAMAMTVGWLAHRRFTFQIRTAPKLREFLSYVGVAWIAIGVNYLIFLAIIFVYPALPDSLAIVLSSAVAMVVSYVGMRFGVFGKTVRCM